MAFLRSLLLFLIVCAAFYAGVEWQKLRGEYWSINAYVGIARELSARKDQGLSEVDRATQTIHLLMKNSYRYIDTSYMRYFFYVTKGQQERLDEAGSMIQENPPKE